MKSHEVTATERSEIPLIGYGFIRSVFTKALISFMSSIEARAFDFKFPSSLAAAIMKALADRRSEREFADKKLSLQDLSDLLWAANGVNRPDGKRTAASALNKQDISIYAIMEEGSYLYDAKTHQLTPVASGDFRPLIGGQQTFVNKAPLCLLMVSDISLFGGGERAKITAALDAGIVSQNIMLFCSGCGLSTVPRASMDVAGLKKALKLTDNQLPLINNPVGYPKK